MRDVERDKRANLDRAIENTPFLLTQLMLAHEGIAQRCDALQKEIAKVERNFKPAFEFDDGGLSGKRRELETLSESYERRLGFNPLERQAIKERIDLSIQRSRPSPG